MYKTNIFVTIVVTVVAILTIGIMFAASEANEANREESFRWLVGSESGNSDVYVFTDPETKCQYLTYFYSGTRSPSITVRYNTGGKPMCNVHLRELDEGLTPEAESFEPVQ